MIKIYALIMKEAELVRRVEEGYYSNGLVKEDIPEEKKCLMPDPVEYPQLFSYLKESNGVLLNERGLEYKKIPDFMMSTVERTKSVDEMDEHELADYIHSMQKTAKQIKTQIQGINLCLMK